MSRNIRTRDTVAIPFRYVDSVSATGSANVAPTLTPRLLAIADDFDEYRFIKLRFRIRRSLATGDFAVNYTPGITDNPPTTIVRVSEQLSSLLSSSQETIPSPWVNVSKQQLAGYHPWYKSVAGAGVGSDEEIQGALYYVNSGTFAGFIEMEGVCEFRAAANSATTPMERALSVRRREKERLLLLLATTDTPSKPSAKRA
jgi:hypothetical protein